MPVTAGHRFSRHRSLTSAAKGRFGIYRTEDGRFLLVPSEDQWLVHEASKACAICVEANLGRAWWLQSAQRYSEHWPWLAEYLRHAGPWRTDSGLDKPTALMLAFREHSTIRAIFAAAERPHDRRPWRKDYRQDISETMLTYWRRQVRWQLREQLVDEVQIEELAEAFDRWLLRGEDLLPPKWTVVSAEQARRVTRWLDFAAHCAGLGLRKRRAQRRRRSMRSRPDSTYGWWIRKGRILSLGCLKWLFGFSPPDGVYVVKDEFRRLRHEMGRKGILAALDEHGISVYQDPIWRWQRHERTRGPINSILAGGKGKDGERWEELDAETQRRMRLVEEVVSLDACLQRACLSRSQYYNELDEAKGCGAKKLLLAYLASEGRFAPPRKNGGPEDDANRVSNRRCGLVAPNFFIPAAYMWPFRARAKAEATKQRVWELVKKLPGFDHWFVDLTAPKGYRGKRHLVSLASTAALLVNQRMEIQGPSAANGPEEPLVPVLATDGHNGDADDESSSGTLPQPECDREVPVDAMGSQAERHEVPAEPLPDGPFDADGFWYQNRQVHFGRAAKQLALLVALWSKKKRRPRRPREILDVMCLIYGHDHDTSDAAFRQLCCDTQRRLDAANLALKITSNQGKVWLAPRPQ
jgi:hypothetical protein